MSTLVVCAFFYGLQILYNVYYYFYNQKKNLFFKVRNIQISKNIFELIILH